MLPNVAIIELMDKFGDFRFIKKKKLSMTSLARMFSEMDYIYITNNSEIATKLLSIGVRWLMVDLEFIGKNNRQIGRDTVISNHSVMDIRAMRAAVETNGIWFVLIRWANIPRTKLKVRSRRELML